MAERPTLPVTPNDSWIDSVKPQPDATNAALPWRRRLATWPDEWRERWGIRADEIEASGVAWIEAERRAWNETLAARKATEAKCFATST